MAGAAAADGAYGVSWLGRLARSTLTPIMSGSDQAETSYGRTMSRPATSFTSG